MGDKTEQPGPSEQKMSVNQPIDADVEGHRKVASKLTDDQPGPSEVRHKVSLIESDEDDVEGHRVYPK